MAKATAQARWRARTSSKRIEVHLPAEAAERLDALASSRGQSRATVIASLITAAPEFAAPTTPVPALPPKLTPLTEAELPERQATGSYRFRRRAAGAPDEAGNDWIAEYQGGLRVGLRRRPDYEFHHWYGRIIDSAGLSPKDAKGHSRGEVMVNLESQYLF